MKIMKIWNTILNKRNSDYNELSEKINNSFKKNLLNYYFINNFDICKLQISMIKTNFIKLENKRLYFVIEIYLNRPGLIIGKSGATLQEINKDCILPIETSMFIKHTKNVSIDLKIKEYNPLKVEY